MSDAQDPRAQLRAHLQFYADLGVAGFTRDEAWKGSRGPGAGHRAPDAVAAPDPFVGVDLQVDTMQADGRLGAPSLPKVEEHFATLDDLRAHIGPQSSMSPVCIASSMAMTVRPGTPPLDMPWMKAAAMRKAHCMGVICETSNIGVWGWVDRRNSGVFPVD